MRAGPLIRSRDVSMRRSPDGDQGWHGPARWGQVVAARSKVPYAITKSGAQHCVGHPGCGVCRRQLAVRRTDRAPSSPPVPARFRDVAPTGHLRSRDFPGKALKIGWEFSPKTLYGRALVGATVYKAFFGF